MAEVTKRGAYATVVLLDEIELTADFADNESDPVDIAPFNQVEVFVDYDDAGGTAAQIKVELQEEEGADFKELSIASDAPPSGGAVLSTIYPRRLQVEAGSDPQRLWFAFPTGARRLRVSAREEGGTGGVLTVGLKLSGVQKVQ